MKKTVKIKRNELLHEISNLAYVIADVCEGKESPHTLHQTFDICEAGNIDRVDSLITLAAAEAGAVMVPVARLHIAAGNVTLSFPNLPKAREMELAQLTREYLVASVMHGYLSVTLPTSAPPWKIRRQEIFASLQSAAAKAAGCRASLTRRLSPF